MARKKTKKKPVKRRGSGYVGGEDFIEGHKR